MVAGKNSSAPELTWNLSLLLPDSSETTIKADLKKVETAITNFVNKWEKDDRYLSDSDALFSALEDFDALQRNHGVGGSGVYYVSLWHSLDQDNPTIKALLNQVEEFSHRMYNRIQFFTLRLAKIAPDKQKLFLVDSKLEPYRHFLSRLFLEAKYLLSEAEEKILVLKSGPAHSQWTRMTSTFLAKQTRHGKPYPILSSELSDVRKSVRDRAARDINDIFGQHTDVAEHELNAILGNKKIDDELRGITRPDLPRHLSDDIDSEVVDAMTTAVTQRFDLPARHYRLKAQMLGVPQLKYHERNVPFGKIEKKYPFPDAVQLVSQTFAKLDQQFADILQGYLDSGQIDVYPKVGKRGGAFCANQLISLPTYILLNHTDKLQDVLTLAHEVGHGINNELMKSQAKAVNFDSPLSVAEVASTFMEDFVLEELLKTANPKLRLALYIRKLDDDMSTIFRQVAAYNFEKELHARFREEGYLSAQTIGQLFTKHMVSYMGDGVSQDPGSENWWVGWSHFRSFFYVYSYASGLLISKALQNKVKQDPKFISSVKRILAAGSEDSPKAIFAKHAALDITDANFWTNGIKEVELLLQNAEKLWEEVK